MSHYHFIGIGGTGLSPIARILLERGHQVSGSDVLLSPLAQDLRAMGARLYTGHASSQIDGADVVIRSSAIPDSNPEVIAAEQANIPVLKRVDFLRDLTAGQKVMAIAGTHGKTTTTAMLAWCLDQMGLDPSYVVGGTVKNLGKNAHAGKGDYFVIEADEYDSMFLGLIPDFLVVTNIEHDHPDFYPTPAVYYAAFQKLVNLIPQNGKLFACLDHPAAAELNRGAPAHIQRQPYGTSKEALYQISNIHHPIECGVAFDLSLPSRDFSGGGSLEIELEIPGSHNALNAAAALAVIHSAGLDTQQAATALRTFSGSGRRFDIQAEIGGITLIDDYAHHPTEIRSTLAAARCRYPDRHIWAVWQPHTYSRTRELMTDFIQAFDDCDHVVVTEIYASREPIQDFSSVEVVRRMQHPDARYISSLNETSDYLTRNLKPGDVLLVLSAGDADLINRQVIAYLKGGA